MRKLYYIFFITFITFTLLSIYYKFDYVDQLNFDSVKEELETEYENNYTLITAAIDERINDNLQLRERGVYLLTQIHFAIKNEDYSLVYDSKDYIEEFLLSQGMTVELIYLYHFLSQMYKNSEDYHNLYLTADKGETLLNLLLSKNYSLDKWIQLLTFTDLKIKATHYTGMYAVPLFEKNYMYSYLDIAEAYEDTTFYYKLYQLLINKYYFEDNHKQVVNHGVKLTSNHKENILFGTNYTALLIRLATSYIKLNDVDASQNIYNYLQKNSDDLSLQHKAEYLYLESKLNAVEKNYNSSIKKLNLALKYSQTINHIYLQHKILDDLIFYTNQINNSLETNRYIQLKTNIKNTSLSHDNMSDLISIVASNRFRVTHSYTIFSSYKRLREYQFVVTVAITFTVALVSFIFCLYKKSRNAKLQNKKIKHLKDHLDNQLSHYDTITSKQLHIRQIHHDMKNHYQIMQQLSSQKDYSALDNYLNDLGQNIQDLSYTRYTNHHTLDALLSAKYHLCCNKKITLTTKVDLPEIVQISDTTLVTIFSNIFDNAVESCDSITSDSIPKEINLIVKSQGNLIYITMTNTKQHKIVQKNNLLKTTKNNKENHGICLASVKNAIKPYGGVLKFTYTETSFTINILLRQKV